MLISDWFRVGFVFFNGWLCFLGLVLGWFGTYLGLV